MVTDDNVIIFPGAKVLGNVSFGKGCSVWYNAVMRGDKEIIVGDNCNIQDCCIFHSDSHITTLGNNVTVGHGAIVHGATIGDNVLVGMGSIVLDGATIGNNCFIAAGSLVTGKTKAPDGSFLMGSPAKIVRSVSKTDVQQIENSWQTYKKESEEYKNNL